MPVCINSKESIYKGTEPSPKGLGYCAHGEYVDTKMKGLDGNMWIVKDYNGINRWVKYNTDFDKLLDKLYHEWWRKLGHGGLLVVYDDGTYEIIETKTMIKRKPLSGTEQWKQLGEQNDVHMIVWSAMSTDVIYQFVEKIIKNKELTKKLLKSKNTLKILLQNPNKFFMKYKYLTDKDYFLKI